MDVDSFWIYCGSFLFGSVVVLSFKKLFTSKINYRNTSEFHIRDSEIRREIEKRNHKEKHND